MKRQISDETAKSVVSSVDKLCDYVDSGLSPVEAGAKVASERDLSKGQIELVCRSYNNGVVNATRREGDKLSAKFSVQNYADPARVIDIVFPSSSKESSEAVADIYKDAAVRMLVIKKKKANPGCGCEEKKEDDCGCECDNSKESADKSDICDCGCGEPKSECKHEEHKSDYAKSKEKMAEMTALLDEKRKLASEARNSVWAAHDAFAAEQKGKFASDKDLAENLAQYHKMAVAAGCDDTATLLIEQVAEAKLSSLWFDHFKTSRESILGKQSSAINTSAGFLGAVSSAVEKLAAFHAFSLEMPKKAMDIHREAHLLLDGVDSPESKGLTLPGKTARATEDLKWEKVAFGLTSTLMAMQAGARNAGRPNKSRLPYIDAKLRLNDPAHQQEIRKLKAEMMLNDIMSRDEILASYSPLEVANAYEDLAASAPALVNNRAMLQTNLKRMLHGNLMPADAKDIVEANREVESKPIFKPKQFDTPGAREEGDK